MVCWGQFHPSKIIGWGEGGGGGGGRPAPPPSLILRKCVTDIHLFRHGQDSTYKSRLNYFLLDRPYNIRTFFLQKKLEVISQKVRAVKPKRQL